MSQEQPRGDTLTPSQRARLNAPPGYAWTDDEVLFEKNMSAMSGWIHGLFIGALIGWACTVAAMAVFA